MTIKKQKGSVLAYSLVILSVMLLIAAGISSTSILEKKSANTTEASTQAFQTAESGLNIAIKKLSAATPTTLQINDTSLFPSCSGSTVSSQTISGITEATYDISFFSQSAPTIPLTCTDPISKIYRAKAVGKFKGTERAVDVVVGASLPENFYVIDRYENMQAFDIITTPGTPSIKGSQYGNIKPLAGDVGVIIINKIAYIIRPDTKQIESYDISTLGSKVFKGAAATTNVPTAIAISNGYAYVSETGGYLEAFEINITTGAITKRGISAASAELQPWDVAISGDYAYVVGATAKFQIFNISNKTSPVVGNTITAPSALTSIAISNGYAYAATVSPNESLKTFDIGSTLGTASLTGSVALNPLSGTASTGVSLGIAIADGYIYVTNDGGSGAGTFQVFEIKNNPANPTWKDSKTTNMMSPVGVIVSNGYAYVLSSFNNAIRVFDIKTNPGTLNVVGAAPISSGFTWSNSIVLPIQL